MSKRLRQRQVAPELLDSLPEEDPHAIGSRRDLVWINALMFQSRIMASMLGKYASRPHGRILEIGSGDGAFMLSVARRLGRTWHEVDLVMVDKANLVTDARRGEFADLGWRLEAVAGDVFDWIDTPGVGRFDIACANLVLHHFEDKALIRLFAAMQHVTSVFLATEPSRNPAALAGCALLKVIGVNDVTRHDAKVSVRAGFRDDDLTRLWPRSSAFRIDERRIGPFTHAFAAECIQ